MRCLLGLVLRTNKTYVGQAHASLFVERGGAHLALFLREASMRIDPGAQRGTTILHGAPQRGSRGLEGRFRFCTSERRSGYLLFSDKFQIFRGKNYYKMIVNVKIMVNFLNFIY